MAKTLLWEFRANGKTLLKEQMAKTLLWEFRANG
jgi:hypothetical protein